MLRLQCHHLERTMRIVIAFLAGILDWIARLAARPPSRDTAEPPSAAATPTVPHSRFGGRAWRWDERGVHADGRLWRTPGEPATCRAILDLYGDIIVAAARRHGIDPALIVMTIATETGSFRSVGFTGPRTFRWEKHVINRDTTPAFKGSYSAGPMQVLATTARDIIDSRGIDYGLAYRPLVTAPALRKKPSAPPSSLALYDAAVSVDIGAAVIRRGLALTGNDPVLVAAAYNSGGLYRTRANAWRLRSHGDHLDRAARWYGDACHVLGERGLRQPR
jgi:peptidoglycan L-alanyl-D-glutamate endopeptidase CwlK